MIEEKVYPIITAWLKNYEAIISDRFRDREIFLFNIQPNIVDFVLEIDRNRVCDTEQNVNRYILERATSVILVLEAIIECVEKYKEDFDFHRDVITATDGDTGEANIRRSLGSAQILARLTESKALVEGLREAEEKQKQKLLTHNFALNNMGKIKWLGKQKELAELFVTLEGKGWIEKIEDGDRSKIARSILQLFDITQRANSKPSNPNNSFRETFTGDIDHQTKKRHWNFKIFVKGYKRKFDKIIGKI